MGKLLPNLIIIGTLFSIGTSYSQHHVKVESHVGVRVRVNGEEIYGRNNVSTTPTTIYSTTTSTSTTSATASTPSTTTRRPAKDECGEGMRLNSHNECECCLPDERPSAYYNVTGKCYYLYTQGPCPEGEWLIQSQGTAECHKNPCYPYAKACEKTQLIVKPNYVLSGGKCVLLGSKCGYSYWYWCEQVISFRSRHHIEPECLLRTNLNYKPHTYYAPVTVTHHNTTTTFQHTTYHGSAHPYGSSGPCSAGYYLGSNGMCIHGSSSYSWGR